MGAGVDGGEGANGRESDGHYKIRAAIFGYRRLGDTGS
jgi:hypothetical protein